MIAPLVRTAALTVLLVQLASTTFRTVRRRREQTAGYSPVHLPRKG